MLFYIHSYIGVKEQSLQSCIINYTFFNLVQLFYILEVIGFNLAHFITAYSVFNLETPLKVVRIW